MSGRHITAMVLAAALAASMTTVGVDAWGAQGHRLVALIATARLTPTTRSNARYGWRTQAIIVVVGRSILGRQLPDATTGTS